VSVIGRGHSRVVHPRRNRVLTSTLRPLLPDSGTVLDIGCGDGLLAASLGAACPRLEVSGIDVLVRDSTHIPVAAFDGRVVPFADQTFDATMLVDVLHHSDDPAGLLAEAVRVSKSSVLIKDHLTDAVLAIPRLRLMDRVGNRRHGVDLPGNYQSSDWWLHTFEQLGVERAVWDTKLHLYPAAVDWLFGGSLHFVARLERV
jgi:ubiquinone/menaquinone biosynthesis C-methylase UbiE